MRRGPFPALHLFQADCSALFYSRSPPRESVWGKARRQPPDKESKKRPFFIWEAQCAPRPRPNDWIWCQRDQNRRQQQTQRTYLFASGCVTLSTSDA